jgi:hypothetical protein
VGHLADFEGEVLGNEFGGGSFVGRMGLSILGIGLCHMSHEGILGVLLVAKRWACWRANDCFDQSVCEAARN